MADLEKFEALPPTIKFAIAFRAELEHFGWADEAFIAYGCKIANAPLEAAHAAPPNSTLVSVHLRLDDARQIDSFVVVAGYLDNEAWPAEDTLNLAVLAWNRLDQDERTAIRRKYVTTDDASRLIASLLARGVIPPAAMEGKETAGVVLFDTEAIKKGLN